MSETFYYVLDDAHHEIYIPIPSLPFLNLGTYSYPYLSAFTVSRSFISYINTDEVDETIRQFHP
jgi:hypothetical protein